MGEQIDRVVFCTACDAEYFSLCSDLIASIRAVRGEFPTICVLDVGLRREQLAELRNRVERVIEPMWELGQKVPPWLRTITSRLFLPKYVPDAEIIVWIDADAWVQTWHPLSNLIDASRDGALAIVEERFGAGFAVSVPSPTETKVYRYSAASVKDNLRLCYNRYFGAEIAAAYGDLPAFNAGVFALRRDSPTWAAWSEVAANGLRRGHHLLVDQLALSILIRQGRVRVALQPLETNWVCVHELPWFDADSRKFTVPQTKTPLGVIHLTDAKKFQRLPIPHFPDGVVSGKSLLYRDLEKPDYAGAAKNRTT